LQSDSNKKKGGPSPKKRSSRFSWGKGERKKNGRFLYQKVWRRQKKPAFLTREGAKQFMQNNEGDEKKKIVGGEESFFHTEMEKKDTGGGKPGKDSDD